MAFFGPRAGVTVGGPVFAKPESVFLKQKWRVFIMKDVDLFVKF